MRLSDGMLCVARRLTASLLAFATLSGLSAATQAQSPSNIIITDIGTTDIVGRPAREISITPRGIALSPDGSLYVVDRDHSQVIRLDPQTQSFTVVAGTTVPGFSGDGGPATAAQLNFPDGVAFDAAGNLFIADSGNGRIRRIAAGSTSITTVAGGGSNAGENVPALEASLHGPLGVTIAADGSIYVVEQGAHRVRRVSASTGRIATVAGTGTYGYYGDGGAAQYAQLALPRDVAIDALGNIYIADQINNRVRVINIVTGIITRFAGTGAESWEVIDGSPALETPLTRPSALRFDAQGNLLVAEQGTGRIRKIDVQTSIVTTVVGGGSEFEGVPALQGRIDMPHALAIAANGDLYVSSENMNVIQRVNAATGLLEVVAGNGWWHFSEDHTLLHLAQIAPLVGATHSVAGQFYMLDNNRIRGLWNYNSIYTKAGNGAWGEGGDGGQAINAFLSYPTALAVDSYGNLFVSDQGSHRIRKVDSNTAIINHYAGTGYGYGGDDGPAISATMRQIRDLAVSENGTLYVVEENTPRVRAIDPATGIIRTVVGNGEVVGPLNDGSLATEVALNYPTAIAVDFFGNLYISVGNRIRRVDQATGVITTIAGNGIDDDTGDGGLAINAAIRADDLVVDMAGNIFFTSVFSHRVRKISSATGIVRTIGGTGVPGFSGDGGPAVLAQMYAPRSLALVANHDLLVIESFRVRRIMNVAEWQPQPPPVPDTTPPVIAYAIDGPVGYDNWITGDATVNWIVTDEQSVISSTSGCESVAVNQDTDDLTLTCSATTAGGTASVTAVFRRDSVPPTIAVVTPTDNTALMSGAQLTLQASAVDPGRGSIDQDIIWVLDRTTFLGSGPSVNANIPSGAHSIIAAVHDHAGLDTYMEVNVQVGVQPVNCSARGSNDSMEWIKTVQVGTQAHTFGASGGYGNFTGAAPFDMKVGANTSITLTPGYAAAQFGEVWGIWIDLNRDGAFSSNEKLLTTGGIGALARTIVVPPGTQLGLARMRVVMRYNSTPAACGTFARGEVEDYAVNLTPPPPNYCTSRGQSTSLGWIAQMTLAGATKVSGDNAGYANFTQDAPIPLLRGTNALTLQPNISYPQQWRVWIDFNQDGTFGAEDLVYSAAGGGIFNGSIVVPTSALPGTTRMRVSMRYGAVAAPACGTFSSGEVEDYVVSIPQ